MKKRDSLRYNILTSTLTHLQNTIKNNNNSSSLSSSVGSNSSIGSSGGSGSTSPSNSTNSSACNSVNNSYDNLNMMSCIKQQSLQSPYHHGVSTHHNEQSPDSWYSSNHSPDDQRSAETYQKYLLTVAFFKVFTNHSLRAEITKHLQSPRSIFSEDISYRPLQYQRYNQINSAEWIIANSHFGLLMDKLESNRPLVFNHRAITLLASKCRDEQLLKRIYNAKRDYFINSLPSMVDSVIESGNINVLRYLCEEQGCILPPTALDMTIRAGNHLEVFEYIFYKRKRDGIQHPQHDYIPMLFKLSLFHRRLTISRFLFDKIGFFLSGPMEDLFRLLCCNGDFEFFKKVYESFQLVMASSSYKEYYLYLADLLDYQTTPLHRDHFKIITYIERGNPKVLVPNITPTMSDPAMYSLFIRWIYLNKQKVVGSMINSILKTAVHFNDSELFEFASLKFSNPHPSRLLQLACSQGSLSIVKYILQNNIESLTYRSLQLAYFHKHKDIVSYIRDNIKSIPIDSSYQFCKPLEYTCSYPIEILEASLCNLPNTTTTATTQTNINIENINNNDCKIEKLEENEITKSTVTTNTTTNTNSDLIVNNNNNDNIVDDASLNNNRNNNNEDENNNNNNNNSNNKITDPILQILSSPNILDADTLQDIFTRALQNGDSEVIMFIVDNRVNDINITRQIWQMVAKIGDPKLFDAMLVIHKRTKEGNNMRPSVIKTFASRLAVDACIWGQEQLLKHIIQQHEIEMDQQQVEYLITSATFNGNANIIRYLMENFKISKKTQATLMRHSINYKHFDLIRLYYHEYSVPLDKKLLKHLNLNVDSFKKPYKKTI